MRKTAEAAARTRKAVLDAALLSFAENGWDRSTLEGIGRRVGLTRGAVCHHFRDKGFLLRATLREGWGHQSELLLRPLLDPAVSPPQRLIGFIANYLDKLGSDPALRALVIVTTLVAPHIRDVEEGMDDHRLALDVWREHLTRVINLCALRPDVAAREAHFSLLALITGATLEASADPGHLPDRAAARAVAVATVRGWVGEE